MKRTGLSTRKKEKEGRDEPNQSKAKRTKERMAETKEERRDEEDIEA